MKNVKFITALFCMVTPFLLSCGGGGDDGVETPPPSNPSNPNGDNSEQSYSMVPLDGFAKGADISWVTEMEASGYKFQDKAGQETDCFLLMRNLGMNSIRLRVWVNPENAYGKWCDAADVVAKAVRAKEKGLHVMIDFHYSDFFADPSRQDIPQAWSSMTIDQLKTAVANHTKSVLSDLKAKGVTPDWVQVGNETRNGMLWPSGQLWTDKGDIANGWQNYASLSNAGYDAVKSVFPNVIVLVHNNNAWEDLDWWFKKFKAAGGKFDMIGLSHYPQVEDGKSAAEVNALALNHITTLGTAYGVPVMIAEVGVTTVASESNAKAVLAEFYKGAKQNKYCAGVFYWEPEVDGQWKPAYYQKLGWNAYNQGAFSTKGRPTSVLDVFAQ